MEEMYTFVKDFTYTMTMCPVPPAGNVIVVSSIYLPKIITLLYIYLVCVCYRCQTKLAGTSSFEE